MYVPDSGAPYFNWNLVIMHDLLPQRGGRMRPDWASLTLGVFVCQACSLLHRSIPHISRVKSIQETWDASDVELVAALGNTAAKAKYEQKVPAFYYRPTHTDCKLLREQWIRAKYERNEFEFIEKQEPYSSEGFLWKRGRDNGQFLSRKFILSEREGALKYFNKQDARDPKAVMKIETLNATFQPAKIGNPCGLQITYLKDNSTRNIFVYHSDAKEMVDWFNSIRAARFHYLQVAFPGASDEELVPKLTRNFMREGFMEKTGPKVCAVFISFTPLKKKENTVWRSSIKGHILSYFLTKHTPSCGRVTHLWEGLLPFVMS
uniref:ArfGAP with dual PH domains 1 n=1 Tax=Labrus bergylta TaxID=56723 RepID=A0A3Q3FER6_9LABR